MRRTLIIAGTILLGVGDAIEQTGKAVSEAGWLLRAAGGARVESPSSEPEPSRNGHALAA